MVVLVSFLAVPEWEGNLNLDCVEMFAGVARIARLASWAGYRSRAYDVLYTLVNPEERKRGKLRRSAMDLNGAAGLVWLGKHWGIFFTVQIGETCVFLLIHVGQGVSLSNIYLF